MTRERITKQELYQINGNHHIDLTDSSGSEHHLETPHIWKHRALFCLQKGYSNEYYPNFVSYRSGLGFNAVKKVEIQGVDTKHANEIIILNIYNQKPRSGRYTRMLESECECKVTLKDDKKIKLDCQEDALMSALINGSELYINGEYVYDVFFHDGNEFISLFELDTSGPAFLGKTFGLYEKFLKNYRYGAKRPIRNETTAEFLINQFCHKARKGIDVKLREVDINETTSEIVTEENGKIQTYQTPFEDALIIKDVTGCEGYIHSGINNRLN